MSKQFPHSPYSQLGGEQAIRALVDRFYDLMDNSSNAKTVRDMHPESLQGSRQKLTDFLSGFLGGPSIYVEKYGHPQLRMRHHSFAIDKAASDAWLSCMNQALDEQVEDPLLLMQLKASFKRTATHLINCESVDG